MAPKNEDRWQTYLLKKERDLGSNVNVLLVPKVVLPIAEEFDEGDQRTPGVRTVNKEPLEQDSRHHLPEPVDLNLVEEIQHQGAEPMCVGIGVAEVQHHGAQ